MLSRSFQRYIDQLYERFLVNRSGEVADYIPELSRVDPDLFGIAVVTVDGHVYQAGDSRHSFTIQSVSKAFAYGIALEDRGAEWVASKIDVEPSGEAFNSISLEPETGRPRNPMINAGAIAVTSLVDGDDGARKIARILEKFGHYTGGVAEIDEEVYLSEKATGHRNRAIAYMLRNYDILNNDPEDPLDAYFRQCAILTSARNLALMGASLANDGVNPITGVRVLKSEHVPRVLSVMATCGMYDYSGNWIHRVGMPAKSGVGGGIVAVLPGQLGIAVFSPRLDEKGNSVRGIAVCEAFSEDLGLHMLKVTRTTTVSVIRTGYTCRNIRSKIHRDTESWKYLEQHGDNIQILELTGELMFASAEIVVSAAIELMRDRTLLIMDFHRVTAIDQSACSLIRDLVDALFADDKTVQVTGILRNPAIGNSLKRNFDLAAYNDIIRCRDLDEALEFAENQLLSKATHLRATGDQLIPLESQVLCENLGSEELGLLRGLVSRESYKAGELICCEGSLADKLYFLMSGRISVSLKLDGSRRKRLSSSNAGTAFGESALFESQTRTADIIAETDVELLSLEPSLLRNMDGTVASSLSMKLLANMSRITMQRLAQANKEIRVLTG